MARKRFLRLAEISLTREIINQSPEFSLMTEELRGNDLIVTKGEKSFVTDSFELAFEWLESEAIKGQIAQQV